MITVEEASSDYDREKLEERLAKLAGGVAVLRVGGATEVEAKERKDRVDDALHATRAAVEEGILPGGGTALLYSVRALDNLSPANDDQRFGVSIVKKALRTPACQIIDNTGAEGSLIIGKLMESTEDGFGFDAQKDEFCNMIERLRNLQLASRLVVSACGHRSGA